MRLRAESRMGEQRCQFKEREPVCREHIQGIAKQLIRACAEPIQAPIHLEQFCDLCDRNKIGITATQRVKAD